VPAAVTVACVAVGIQVPFNTMLADLDDALRSLLRAELASHGFSGVEIAFDAPTRDWASGRAGPTLDLFLYDVRQASGAPGDEWRERRSNGASRLERPPARVDCSYAVTAWTRAVEDEHRLLSQAMAILLAFEHLPGDALGERLAALDTPVRARIGHPRNDATAEFWGALGAQYKLSVDYVVTLPCDTGIAYDRGPEVRTHTLRLGDLERGRTAELHRVGGTVRGGDGEPAAGAWLLLPDAGAWARSADDGRYAFDGIAAGTHRCECRGTDGAVASGDLVVPGPGLDLVLGAD
jgi:hypothetical protein